MIISRDFLQLFGDERSDCDPIAVVLTRRVPDYSNYHAGKVLVVVHQL